jgi:hypothetical protein
MYSLAFFSSSGSSCNKSKDDFYISHLHLPTEKHLVTMKWKCAYFYSAETGFMQVICTVKYKVFAIKQWGKPGRWRVLDFEKWGKNRVTTSQGVYFIVFPSLAENFPNWPKLYPLPPPPPPPPATATQVTWRVQYACLSTFRLWARPGKLIDHWLLPFNK